MRAIRQHKYLTIILSAVVFMVGLIAALFLKVNVSAGGVILTTEEHDFGNGEEAACVISSEAELNRFAERVNGGETTLNAILTADITLTAPGEGKSNFTPIGTVSDFFNGKFDGQGHVIKGIVINSESDYQGLFGFAYTNSLIENVGVTDGSIKGKAYVGGICGTLTDGTISNCYNENAITGDNTVGGICGLDSFGTISNCYNKNAITGTKNVGGICGSIEAALVSDCLNEGDIYGDNAGGICGEINGSTKITTSVSTGKISGGTIGSIGGGPNTDGITNCYYNKDAFAENTAINDSSIATGKTLVEIAELKSSDLSEIWTFKEATADKLTCYIPMPKKLGLANTIIHNFGDSVTPNWQNVDVVVDSTEDLNRFAERVNGGEATLNAILTADITLTAPGEGKSNFASIGTSEKAFDGKFDGQGHVIKGIVINSESDYQGLFGFAYTNSLIKNVGVTDGSIKGKDYVGGICGNMNGGTISGCYNENAITGDNTVGGICGLDSYGTISNCYNKNAITGEETVGGICGYIINKQISDCLNEGNVNGTGAGGICGYAENATINTSVSTGKVSGSAPIGGICATSTFFLVSKCYYNTDAFAEGTELVDGKLTSVHGKTLVEIAGLTSSDLSEIWTFKAETATETADNLICYIPMPKAIADKFSLDHTSLMAHNFGDSVTPNWQNVDVVIDSAEDLNRFAERVNGGEATLNAILTADITLTAPGEGKSNFTPIGTVSNSFNGKFDGQGHVIKGIVINSESDYQGLFGFANTGIVKKCAVEISPKIR